MRTFIALATTLAFLFTGCAGERPWPARPVAVATPAFATQSEVGTIDVLPLDLQLWAEPGYEHDVTELRAGAEVNIMSVALETLAKRNYSVGATIDWNGDFPGGNALTRDDLFATVSSLGRYGATAAEYPGQLPVPYLPARLGTATGADATLYVGGWAYVAKRRESTGEQVAQAVLIGLLIISVVAIVAMVASRSKSGGHGGKHGGGHSHSGGRHHGGGRPSGGGGGRPSGGGGHVSGGHGHGGGGHLFSASRGEGHAWRAAMGVADAFGRAAIDVAVASQFDWAEDPNLPHEGAESQMYLEMTLVDNRTGLALWHARQTFPASAASPDETARVARTMLTLLPGRVTRTAAN